MTDLNETEVKVMNELVRVSDYQGHDWGDSDDVEVDRVGITTRQLSGYVSQLVQKGYITSLNDYDRERWGGCFRLTLKGAAFAGLDGLNYETN